MYLLMTAVPLALAAVLLHAAPGPAAVRPPVVELSVDATALVPLAEPGADARTPIRLPGYLLPDDGAEEPAHAGG